MSTMPMTLLWNPTSATVEYASDNSFADNMAEAPRLVGPATNLGVLIRTAPPTPSISWVPFTANRGLRGTLRAIDELMDEPEEDELGSARPTQFARKTAIGLIQKAASLSAPFRTGSASTDATGGLRLTWRTPASQLRMVIGESPDARSYLYWQAGDRYEITESVTSETVSAALRWLAEHSEE